MSFTQKDMTGACFKNKKKEKDTHADYTGSAMIGGIVYWCNTWIKKDKNGDTYFSSSFKERERKSEQPDDKDIPF